MPRLQNKNEWGAAGSNLDPQRADLFKVKMELPDALVLNGFGTWYNDVEFAIETWPFPERDNETIPMKYMNQVNHILGANAPTAKVVIQVRYAFNQPTAQLLERWNYLTSNPRTGGGGMTSQVKGRGEFMWLYPNMEVQKNVESTSPSDDTLVPGLIYVLEGCMVSGLKPTDGDMKTGNVLVNLAFSLTIDRYYPKDLRKMIFGNYNVASSPNRLL
jgi:hypothetical protein